jgi:hypothetical protein
MIKDMDTFPPAFLSLWFKCFVVISVVLFITKMLRHFVIDKTIAALIRLPEQKKKGIISIYQSSISTWKIWLRLAPLMLILMILLVILPIIAPSLTAADLHPIRQFTLLFILSMVVAYIHMLEDSFYKKKILKAIDKSTERETL